jgi:hypothetical protein
MDEHRIRVAANRIENCKAALAWLDEHGVKLTGRDDAIVKITLLFADGCDGAKEATSIMESYARLDLPEVVKSAIACCRNDIDIETNAIRAELEK